MKYKEDYTEILVELDRTIVLHEYKSKLPKAYDIINNEDINICDFLNDLEFNIILKIKDVYYGFERFDLIKALKNSAVFNESTNETFYKSPWRHLLEEDALNSLLYLDFSFYEIVETDKVALNQKLHILKEYSSKRFIKKFIKNEKSKLFNCCSK